VLFSSNGVMADSNLLGQAIDYVAKTPGISLSLGMTRFKGMVGARMDMDQSQFPSAVSPDSGAPGIYDTLIPILQAWKQQYNFTGSYYISVGDNLTPADPQVSPSTTDWAKSLPYYQAILAMDGEIGNHSYTHLINQPTTTFTARTTTARAAGATRSPWTACRRSPASRSA
jgi:serralysin